VLSTLGDPRGRRGRRHELATVLIVALAGVVAGARSLAGIAGWGSDLPRWAWPRGSGSLGDRRAWRPSAGCCCWWTRTCWTPCCMPGWRH